MQVFRTEALRGALAGIVELLSSIRTTFISGQIRTAATIQGTPAVSVSGTATTTGTVTNTVNVTHPAFDASINKAFTDGFTSRITSV